jgi:hypothetical protein
MDGTLELFDSLTSEVNARSIVTHKTIGFDQGQFLGVVSTATTRTSRGRKTSTLRPEGVRMTALQGPVSPELTAPSGSRVARHIQG